MFARIRSPFLRRLLDDRGATMAEYAILIAVIAVVVVAGARALGTQVNTRLDNAATTVRTGR